MPDPAAAAADPAAEPSLPGWSVDLNGAASAEETRRVLETAFDYRGDITLTLADGRDLTGYLFDRVKGTGLSDSFVRLLAPGSDEKVKVPYEQVKRIAFSDRDPAAGKSFETWIKKYVEKKLAGEAANIESEELE